MVQLVSDSEDWPALRRDYLAKGLMAADFDLALFGQIRYEYRAAQEEAGAVLNFGLAGRNMAHCMQQKTLQPTRHWPVVPLSDSFPTLRD
ncbi:MAG: hypothetical protein NVS1B11_02560 [Terriglobales bacterium]